MKVIPIDKKLRDAIAVLVNYNMGYHEFTTDQNKLLLRNSLELLEEYVSCFDVNGDVSQRGEVPICWNKDTIFECSKESLARFNNKYNQLEFEFESSSTTKNIKKVQPLEENTDGINGSPI